MQWADRPALMIQVNSLGESNMANIRPDHTKARGRNLSTAHISKRDAEYFLELTSVYDMNALRQIAEGMASHSRYVNHNSEAYTAMENVTSALKAFIALRIRAIGASEESNT
jgi:hypothetical protein